MRALRPPWSHRFIVSAPPTTRDTCSLATSLRRGECQGLGTIHERWHYRSCEDPLKPPVGLLCGAQPDRRVSFRLEVKPLLVLAWGTVEYSMLNFHQEATRTSR